MGSGGQRLLFLMLLGLFASSAFAQADNSPDFIMTLSTQQKQWDTRTPLTVNVAIKNLGRKRFYVGLKCSFGFEGVLEYAKQDSIRYFVKFNKDQDELCRLTREDLIEIPPRRTVNIKLTSVNVEKFGLGDVSWENHLPGNYRLTVRYGTSKVAPFKDVWLGVTGTQHVKIRVK